MNRILCTLLLVAALGCDKDSRDRITYELLITDGNESFTTGDYAAAVVHYSNAIVLNGQDPRGHAGLGWTYLKLDSLSLSAASFAAATAVRNADLFAGWAFVSRAQGNFAASNQQADSALVRDPFWSFAMIPSLSASDLHLLKAGNYFLLGEYANSKMEVVILDSSFASVDVTTDSGRAQLAQKIEDLKALTKSRWQFPTSSHGSVL